MLAGHDRLALGLQPRAEPGRGARAAEPRARADAGPGLITRPPSTATPSAVAAAAVRGRRTAQGQQGPVLHVLGRGPARATATATGNIFGGGLKIRTTLDLELQKAAEQAINGRLAGVGPSAALVAIDNNTGGIRAMVGGGDFQKRPFNLATQGTASRARSSSRSRWSRARGRDLARAAPSSRRRRPAPGPARRLRGPELRGPLLRGDLAWRARPTVSDNSVYAEVGYKLVGTSKSRSVARTMGVRTPHLTQPRDGPRRTQVRGHSAGDRPVLRDARRARQARERVLLGIQGRAGRLSRRSRGPASTTRTTSSASASFRREPPSRPCRSSSRSSLGHRPRGPIGEFAAGKTGTTENYQDAWFVGFNDELTVAVWVGYPDSAQADADRVPRPAGRGRHLSRPRSGTTSCCRSARSRTHAPSPRTTPARRRLPCRDPCQIAARRTRSSRMAVPALATARRPTKPSRRLQEAARAVARRLPSRPPPSPHRRPRRLPIRPAEEGPEAGRATAARRERGWNDRRPRRSAGFGGCRTGREISKVRPMTTWARSFGIAARGAFEGERGRPGARRYERALVVSGRVRCSGDCDLAPP